MNKNLEIAIIEAKHILPEKLPVTGNAEDQNLHPFARDDENIMYMYYQSTPNRYEARVLAEVMKEEMPELRWAFGVGVEDDNEPTSTIDPYSSVVWREWRKLNV